MPFNIPLLIAAAFLLLRSTFVKERLAKLKPSDITIGCTGCYVILTTVLDYIIEGFIFWYILQFATGLWLIGYALTSKKGIPSWKVSRCWLISAIFCLPVNVLWHWWHVTNPSFALTLSVAHLIVILFVFPLYLGKKLVGAMLLVIIYSIYCMGMPLLLESGDFLLSLLGLSLMIFAIIIYNKRKLAAYRHHGDYLKNKAKLKEETEEKLRQIAFNLYSDPETVRNNPIEAQAFVEKIMEEVTQFISYLDDRPLYKEDLPSIIRNFNVWDSFLKQRARTRQHLLLILTEINPDELIRKLEVALETKGELAPKLIIESKDDAIPEKIACDANQMIQLLIPVILRTAHLDGVKSEFVKIQLYTTRLKYEQSNASQAPSEMDFPAIALVVSNPTTPPEALPEIKSYYEDITEGRELQWHSLHTEPGRITIEKKEIERAIRAHYGYFQFPSSPKKAVLMVLPYNAAAVRDKMISKIIPSTVSITQRKFKESIAMLVKSYNHLCTISDIRTAAVDQMLLLMRRCYGFRRHASGQLFYIRALGIAQVVSEWIRYYPHPIYGIFLSDVVRYTGLPLSYIKANYSMDMHSFIQNILSINKREDMEPCAVYAGNRLKDIIYREQVHILYIKFAERFYDLSHAKNYTDLEEVKHMAKETLTVDVELAKKYSDAKVVEALATAAQEALQLCKGQC